MVYDKTSKATSVVSDKLQHNTYKQTRLEMIWNKGLSRLWQKQKMKGVTYEKKQQLIKIQFVS